MLPPSPVALTNGHGKTGVPKTSIVTGSVSPADTCNSRKSPSPSGRHCSSPVCNCNRSPQMSPSLARSREMLKVGMKRNMQFAIIEHPQCEDEAAANSGDSMDSLDDENFCHIIQPGEISCRFLTRHRWAWHLFVGSHIILCLLRGFSDGE